MTPLRIWAASTAVVALVGLVVVLVVGSRNSPVADKTLAAEKEVLVKKVHFLEEELQKKELELTVREKRLHEKDKGGERISAVSPEVSEPAPPVSTSRGGAPVREDDGPLTSLQDQTTGQTARRRLPERAEAPPDRRASALVGSPSQRESQDGPSQSARLRGQESGRVQEGTPLVSFDAKDVTATSEGPNKGKLSFKLVKDRPRVGFSGYLFVFVEMVDKRGGGRTFAYPQKTRLGDGELPTDFQAGKSLTFKFNSRVDLEYKDPREDASLSRVSILLYAEDGNIVFQRSFDRGEVKLVSAQATKIDSAQPGIQPKPAKKRQAL